MSDILQLAESINVIEVLLEVLHLLQLLGLVASEKGEPHCGLEQDQHCCLSI